MSNNNFSIAIPTRLASTRFPRKALANLNGKSVLERVWLQAKKSKLASNVYILADEDEIIDKASSWGANVIKTPVSCQSGTQRIICALDKMQGDFFVNVQGDEPFICPKLIDDIFKRRIDTNANLITACSKIEHAEDIFNENCVKLIKQNDGKVIYFSRNPIPFQRGVQKDPAIWLKNCDYFKHIGIYGYTKEILQTYSNLAYSHLENAEKLEQLKFLENGYCFQSVLTNHQTIGIDTPEDLEKAKLFLLNNFSED